MNPLLFIALTLFFFSTPAFAGGNATQVHVLKLSLQSDTDYVLVVSPVKKNDSVTRGCSRFEVHGTYSFLEGDISARLTGLRPLFSERHPTKTDHVAALNYLQKFVGSKKTVWFGFMGEGFHTIVDKNPCVVESRALGLSGGHVLSFFHVV